MNFRDLSDKQAEVLGQIAIGDINGHDPRVLKALEAKGLLVGYDDVLGGRFPVRIRQKW